MKEVSGLISFGGDKKIVEAVLGRVSICLNASVKGRTMRFILKNGRATTIWAKQDDVDIAQGVVAIIGDRKCELRLSS